MGFLDRLRALAGTAAAKGPNKYVPPPAETSAERALKEISPEEYSQYVDPQPEYKPYVLPVKYGNWDDMQKDKQKEDEAKYELFLKEKEAARQRDVAEAIEAQKQRKRPIPPGY